MNAYELADDLENSNGLQYITKVGLVSLSAQMLRQQAALIDYYKVRDSSYQKTIAELEKEVKELHKIAQIMALQESNARKSLQNYKDYEKASEK